MGLRVRGGGIGGCRVENWGVDNYIRLGVPSNFNGIEMADWQKREGARADELQGVIDATSRLKAAQLAEDTPGERATSPRARSF